MLEVSYIISHWSIWLFCVEGVVKFLPTGLSLISFMSVKSSGVGFPLGPSMVGMGVSPGCIITQNSLEIVKIISWNKSLFIKTCYSRFCWLKQVPLTHTKCDCSKQCFSEMGRWIGYLPLLQLKAVTICLTSENGGWQCMVHSGEPLLQLSSVDTWSEIHIEDNALAVKVAAVTDHVKDIGI